MLCPVLVLLWALLVAVVPCHSRAVMGTDPDRARALELIKGRILADLGLSSVPSGSRANVTRAHMEHMMRVYRRSVQRSTDPGDRVRGRKDAVKAASAREVMHYYSFKNEGECFFSIALALRFARIGVLKRHLHLNSYFKKVALGGSSGLSNVVRVILATIMT